MGTSLVAHGAPHAVPATARHPQAPPDAVPFARLVIATDRCKACELCIHACPEGVLAIDRDHVNVLGYNPIREVAPERCTSCALCARVCPDVVFTVRAPRLTRTAAARTGDPAHDHPRLTATSRTRAPSRLQEDPTR